MKKYKKGMIPNFDTTLNYSRKNKTYNNTILTFDIETTSAWIDTNGNLTNDKAEYDDADFEEMQPVSLCYLWQLSIEDNVYYGRELATAIECFKEINEKTNGAIITIFIHNLAFEFQFLCGYMTLKKQFSRSAHHSITCEFDEIPNIKFRCSYILTRLSLDNWGKKIGYHKLTGTVDYNKIRTPKTKLEKEMLKYGEADCLVVYYGIKDYLKKYEKIEDIPLTQTGEVRKEVKKILGSNMNHLKFCAELVPANLEMYQKMCRVFMGGYTHANYIYVGDILGNTNCCVNATKETIKCFDFASSYPYCMLLPQYPNTPFRKDYYDEKHINDFAYMLYIKFNDVKPITFNHYISYSKTEKSKNVTIDNGRIMSADEFYLWCTELDFEIIKKTYQFKYEIIECYSSIKGYLPKKYIDTLLNYYEQKTTLKGIEDKADIYMWAKERLNSLYGMCVTSLLYDDIIFNQSKGMWYTDFKNADEVNAKLSEMRTKPKRSNFIAYQWGIWVTALARYNLWTCILNNGTADGEKNVIYCDTDSIKMLDNPNFDWYNKLVDDNLLKASNDVGFDFEKTRPKDKHGVQHPIGHFVKEDDAIEFVTLGAKRYAYRTSDGELHITVSGVPKKCVSELQNDIRNFKDGFIFSRHSEHAPKLLTYLSDAKYMDGLVWQKGQYDEYTSSETWGVNMRNKNYNMSLLQEFSDLVSNSKSRNSLAIAKGADWI